MARPPGIESSPYVGALAKALDINPQTLRNHLNGAGHGPPYLDIERALRLLDTEKAFKKKVAKFRERMAADTRFRELMTGSPAVAGNGKEKPVKKKMKPGHRTPAMEAQKIKAFKAQHMRKLMPRLSMHLVRMKLAKNYKRAYLKATQILRQGKYQGPRWDDEPRCVEIFKEAGIDMSTFEHASEIPIGNGQTLIPAPSTAVVPHKGNGAEVLRPMAAASEDSQRRALEGLRRAKLSLEQWRHNFFDRVQRRQKNDFEDGEEMIVEALVNIRRVPSGR